MADPEDVERQWKTLAGRLQYVIDAKSREDSRWSGRYWSVLAMGEENHGQVAALRRRSMKSWQERGRETDFHDATNEKLSRVAGINPRWLASGVGKPFDVQAPERYVQMPLVREAARSMGIPESFILSYERGLDADGQPSFHELYLPLVEQWELKRPGEKPGAVSPELAAAHAREIAGQPSPSQRPHGNKKGARSPRGGKR